MRQNLIMILRRSDNHGGYNVETHTQSAIVAICLQLYSMCEGLWWKKHDPRKFLLQSVVAPVAWQWRTEAIVETDACELAQTCRMEQDLE